MLNPRELDWSKYMDKELQEIEEKLKSLREEWDELRNRRVELLFEELNLKDKYIYLGFQDSYIHVGEAWLQERDYLGRPGEWEIVLNGETFSGAFGEYKDNTYFSWDLWGQITLPYDGRKPDIKEIGEEEFYKTLDDLKTKLIKEKHQN